MYKRIKSGNRQQGMALIIGLVMTLAMTLIGVTAMRTNSMQEKMVGNAHDRNLAFQAAESALRQAESSLIEGLATLTPFGDGASNGGLYSEDHDEPADPVNVVWSSANSQSYSGTLKDVASPPRFMVKVVKYKKIGGGALNIQGYGQTMPGSESAMFRITARGTGGTDKSKVVLRSHYGKIF